jgi:hypothetical protein
MLTLYALRIELGKSYRQTTDLLSEMPGALDEIGLMRVPHFTVLRDWFEKLPTPLWRAVLRTTTEKRTGHAAVDSTGFDRDQPSRYYAQRAHYRVRSPKVTALVDVVTLYVTDVHCTTTKKHDAKIGPQAPGGTSATCSPWPLIAGTTRRRSATNSGQTAFVP